MRSHDKTTDLTLGVLAGLAGTFFIRAGLAASERWMPQTLPPMQADPGQFIVEKAESALPPSVRRNIPEAVESSAAQVLAFGYGVTFAALYAALPRHGRSTVTDGTLLGAAAWAAGYLGWLPAIGLTTPVWRQQAKQVVPNLLSHAMFGIIVVGTYRALEERL